MLNSRFIAGLVSFLAVETTIWAQVTYSDNFNTNVNYLANGIVGTI